MKRLIPLALVVSLVTPALALGSGADLTETRHEQLDARLLELGFTTKALPSETNVRVLLPDDYDASSSTRYPVLYLLHGCCDFDVDGSRAWTVHGEAEQATKGLPLIVVMPAGGRGGMYSNWQSAGAQGRPQWETYHLGQLIPWIDAHLRTIASREGRAIAGLSMGGFGAMKYAALHPDRFLAAASFSGIVDSNTDDGALHAALPATDGGTAASVWGPRATDELRWRSENPWDLAENLRSLDLTLRTGNGLPGPLDGPDVSPVAAAAEFGVHRDNISLHDRLTALRIRHVWDDYGPGTHSWPYWARDLRETLPSIMADFAHPPKRPRRVTYRTARPAYTVFGWRVRFARTTLAWSRLVGADKRGFTLEGSGAVTVRTPRVGPGRSRVTATIDGATRQLKADRAGRVTLHLRPSGKSLVRLVIRRSKR